MSAVPARFNLARHCVQKPAQERPEQKALTLVSPGGVQLLTHREVYDAVSRVARGLVECGLRRGDRVVIRLQHGSDYAIAFFAAIAAGIIPLNASPQLTGKETEFVVRDCAASALIHDDPLDLPSPLHGSCRVLDAAQFAGLKQSEPIEQFVDSVPDDPAYLIYSSGTTGRPKGVLHAHRAVWARKHAIEGWTGMRGGDVVLHAGHMNWTYTLTVGLMDPWAVGASAVLYSGPTDPRVWPRLIREHQASLFATVPTLFRQILKYVSDEALVLPTLRHGLSAGEPLLAPVLKEWRRRVGTDIFEAYGMSECSTYISSGPSTPIRPGSPGRPQPGRAKVTVLPVQERGNDEDTTPLPPGELGLLALSRDEPALMLRYWNRPDEEAQVFRGPWFIGGDLAEMDADGYVWFKGRTGDLMNSFGFRVSPLEVEAPIRELPGVADVAVAEVVVDESQGISVICAFIVRAGPLEEPDVLRQCTFHLAPYKRPRRVVFLESLPRTARGKLDRGALRAKGPR